jgi:hypothetical protein
MQERERVEGLAGRERPEDAGHRPLRIGPPVLQDAPVRPGLRDEEPPYPSGEPVMALLAGLLPPVHEGDEEERVCPAHYLATRRDEVEGNTIRQPDHWAAYGLATLAPAGLTDVEAEYGRWLAGYFGYLVRFEAQHADDGGLIPYEESGSGLGTIGEATTALWRLSGEDERLADLRGKLGVRSTCLAGILIDRQVPAADANPLARGAWFSDGYTQMDDQQHAVAALLGSGQVLR